MEGLTNRCRQRGMASPVPLSRFRRGSAIYVRPTAMKKLIFTFVVAILAMSFASTNPSASHVHCLFPDK